MKRIFKNGSTVLFQGDSVTDCGRDRSFGFASPGCGEDAAPALGPGYPLKVKKLYDVLFPDNGITFVNRGVSGDRIIDLVRRYDDDVKAVKPDYMTVLIGVNNTWRRFDSGDPTSEEDFRSQYDLFLSKTKADLPGTQIIILEPFAFTQHPDRKGWDGDLGSKRAVAREMAVKYGAVFIPAHDIMQAALADFELPELSPDGVHPADTGHSVLASAILGI